MLADLHIHSCLSPCADISMVPSVIFENEKISIFSITDHNSSKNVRAFFGYLLKYFPNKIFLPGIEIHTLEDVHILGYFPTIEDAEKVGEFIYDSLDDFSYDPEKFGYEIVIDSQENIMETLDKYLGFPSQLSIDEAISLIEKNNGISVFAHVDRKFGAIYQLGFLPNSAKIVEVRKKETFFELKNQGYIVLTSSDAHNPVDVGIRYSIFEDNLESTKDVLEAIISGWVKTLWD